MAMSSVGLQLSDLAPLPTPPNQHGAPDTQPLWVVLVGQPGLTTDVDNDATRTALHWLRGMRLSNGQVELITICAGSVLAAQVAQTMVVALRRGPNDPELSPFLAYRNHLHPAIHRVQDAVSEKPTTNWTVPGMAEVAHTSPRHLTRLFPENTGIPPLQYLRRIRLAVAQTALQSGLSVSRAAETAGFSSDTQLRRAWQQFALAGTPSAA